MASQSNALTPSLTSLRTSTTLLSSSLDILSNATRDLPRLRSVLSQTRHFELAPAADLAAAQAGVLNELAPEIERLLARVEKVVEGRERREEWLRARWALGEGRLGREAGGPSSARQSDTRASTDRTSASAAKDGKLVDESKAKRIRQKKERLSYTVERLQLQANQRERQLRMSMAAQEKKDEVHEEDEF